MRRTRAKKGNKTISNHAKRKENSSVTKKQDVCPTPNGVWYTVNIDDTEIDVHLRKALLTFVHNEYDNIGSPFPHIINNYYRIQVKNNGMNKYTRVKFSCNIGFGCCDWCYQVEYFNDVWNLNNDSDIPLDPDIRQSIIDAANKFDVPLANNKTAMMYVLSDNQMRGIYKGVRKLPAELRQLICDYLYPEDTRYRV